MSALAGLRALAADLRRLLPVELARVRSRQLTLVVLAGTLAFGGLTASTWYSGAQPPSAATVEQARQEYERAARDFAENGAQMQAQCRLDQERARASDPTADFGCEDLRPRPEHYLPPQATFEQSWRDAVAAAGYMGMFMAFLLGATLLGAELSSGSLGTLLTFQPRRLTVLTGKLAAAAAGGAVVGALALAVVVGGVWLVFARFGTSQLPAAEAGQLWATAGRAVPLCALAAVAAAALATLLRHTAAAFGLLVGYLFAVELLLTGFVESLRPWLVQLNVQALLTTTARYTSQSCGQSPAGGGFECRSVEHVLGMPRAGLYLAVLTCLLLAVTALAFRRRDVS